MVYDIVGFLEKQYGIMPAPRALKVRTLYNLAHKHRSGDVVELGTFLGLGTASLCIGIEMSGHKNDFIVYTVDDYRDHTGWAGESYTKSNEEVFWYRMKSLNLNPVLIKKSAFEAAKDWKTPVGLLFWDTGMRNEIVTDMLEWDKHIIVGGTVYLRDTASLQLGSRDAIEALGDKYKIVMDKPTVTLLEKVHA